ncbi:hypothetical protein Avbf_16261 [Armadillidium vulgare]|nr:hypothetical protein Avbf_16261 [Armadillidium vulgare]
MKNTNIESSEGYFPPGQTSFEEATDDGSVAVAAILAAIAVLCVTSGIAFFIYRYYRKRSVHSMNFDNPVYKKTTTEDGFNMAGGHQQRPSSSQNGIRPSQGGYQHRQYGVASSEDTAVFSSCSRNVYRYRVGNDYLSDGDIESQSRIAFEGLLPSFVES